MPARTHARSEIESNRIEEEKRVELKTETAKYWYPKQETGTKKKGYQNRTRDAKHELTFGGEKKNAEGEKKRLRLRFASEGYMCDAAICIVFSRLFVCFVCMGGVLVCPGPVYVAWKKIKKRGSLEEEEEAMTGDGRARYTVSRVKKMSSVSVRASLTITPGCWQHAVSSRPHRAQCAASARREP
jgi:hypothetical protein